MDDEDKNEIDKYLGAKQQNSEDIEPRNTQNEEDGNKNYDNSHNQERQNVEKEKTKDEKANVGDGNHPASHDNSAIDKS